MDAQVEVIALLSKAGLVGSRPRRECAVPSFVCGVHVLQARAGVLRIERHQFDGPVTAGLRQALNIRSRRLTLLD
jgi:hypothetical protein